jgi:hypothetical protein
MEAIIPLKKFKENLRVKVGRAALDIGRPTDEVKN